MQLPEKLTQLERKEGIKALYTIHDDYKIFTAYHILGDFEMPIHFVIYPNNMVIGMNSIMNRIYVGKIGEMANSVGGIEGKTEAEITLFYMDVNPLESPLADLSEVEFRHLVSYKDKLYFNGRFFFFDAFGKDQHWWGLYLPESNGTFYEMVPMTKDNWLKNSLAAYLYALIGQSLKVDPRFYLTLRTIEECCNESTREYDKKELSERYESINASLDIPTYPSRFN